MGISTKLPVSYLLIVLDNYNTWYQINAET